MTKEEKKALEIVSAYLKAQDPQNTGKINDQEYGALVEQLNKAKSVAEIYVLTEQFFFDASKVPAGTVAAPATPTDLRTQLIAQVDLESKNRDNNESKALIAYNLMRGSEGANEGLVYNPDDPIFAEVINSSNHKEAEKKAVDYFNKNKAATADPKDAQNLIDSLHIVPSAAGRARSIVDKIKNPAISNSEGAGAANEQGDSGGAGLNVALGGVTGIDDATNHDLAQINGKYSSDASKSLSQGGSLNGWVLGTQSTPKVEYRAGAANEQGDSGGAGLNVALGGVVNIETPSGRASAIYVKDAIEANNINKDTTGWVLGSSASATAAYKHIDKASEAIKNGSDTTGWVLGGDVTEVAEPTRTRQLVDSSIKSAKKAREDDIINRSVTHSGALTSANVQADITLSNSTPISAEPPRSNKKIYGGDSTNIKSKSPNLGGSQAAATPSTPIKYSKFKATAI